MTIKTFWLSLVAVAVAVAFTASAQAQFKLEGKPKIAMVYFDVKNDGGWTQAIDEARQRLEGQLNIKIPFTEKVPEVASQIRPAVERYIQRGYNIIIGSAFGYSDTFKELAKEYPKVAFLNPAGTTNGPNLQSYYGRTYESQHLCGMVAGAMSKTGKLGFIAAHPIGLVNWTVNAYLLGARRMNPNATVNVVYTGAWVDPVKERAAAIALMEQGVDAIGIHVDTPAALVAAQEKGAFGTGHHRDMREFAVKAVGCSSVWVWDKYLEPLLKKISSGTEWKTQPYGEFLGIVHGGTDIACCGPMVSDDVKKKVMARRQEILNGAHVFEGPIYDQSGKEVIAAGKTPSDADLWGMDYLVKGVVGKL
jgi:basic membrane protein A